MKQCLGLYKQNLHTGNTVNLLLLLLLLLVVVVVIWYSTVFHLP